MRDHRQFFVVFGSLTDMSNIENQDEVSRDISQPETQQKIKSVTIFEDEQVQFVADDFHITTEKVEQYYSGKTLLYIALTFGAYFVYMAYDNDDMEYYFIVNSLDASNIEYIVTDERIISREGWRNKTTETISFEKVVGNIRVERAEASGGSFSKTIGQNMAKGAGFDIGDVVFEVQRSRDMGAEVQKSAATSTSTDRISEREQQTRVQDVRRKTVRLEAVENPEEIADRIRVLSRQ